MKPLRVAEDILPLARAKAELSRVVRDVRAGGRAVVITHNGTPAAVVISPEDFDRMSGRAAVVRAIEEGLADSDAGRVIDDAELAREMDARFGPRRRSVRGSGRRRTAR